MILQTASSAEMEVIYFEVDSGAKELSLAPLSTSKWMNSDWDTSSGWIQIGTPVLQLLEYTTSMFQLRWLITSFVNFKAQVSLDGPTQVSKVLYRLHN